jgi:hypothetical protein
MLKKDFINNEISLIKEILKEKDVKPLEMLFKKSNDTELDEICGVIYHYINGVDNIEQYINEEISKYNMLISLANVNEPIIELESNVIIEIATHLENIMKQLTNEDIETDDID